MLTAACCKGRAPSCSLERGHPVRKLVFNPCFWGAASRTSVCTPPLGMAHAARRVFRQGFAWVESVSREMGITPANPEWRTRGWGSGGGRVYPHEPRVAHAARRDMRRFALRAYPGLTKVSPLGRLTRRAGVRTPDERSTAGLGRVMAGGKGGKVRSEGLACPMWRGVAARGGARRRGRHWRINIGRRGSRVFVLSIKKAGSRINDATQHNSGR